MITGCGSLRFGEPHIAQAWRWRQWHDRLLLRYKPSHREAPVVSQGFFCWGGFSFAANLTAYLMPNRSRHSVL